MEDRLVQLLQETHDSALRSEEKIIGLEQTCGKTEIHLAALNGHIDDHAKDIADIREKHGSRLTRAETKLWVIFGTAGAVVTVVTLLKVFGVI